MVWIGTERKECGGLSLDFWGFGISGPLGCVHLAAPPVYLLAQGEAFDTRKTPLVCAFSLTNLNSREVFR